MTGSEKIFVDTAPFIYFIEGNKDNPQYSDRVKSFFMECYDVGADLYTSVITIEEYSVFPYRNHEHGYIDRFERLIRTLGMRVMDIDRNIAKKAAWIRAEYKGFRAMDALQLATACIMGCDLFFTNDKQLRQFKEVRCITVDELE